MRAWSLFAVRALSHPDNAETVHMHKADGVAVAAPIVRQPSIRICIRTRTPYT